MLLTIFLGIFVGLILAITGAGGGILAVPLLVFFLHMTVAEAAPVSLLGVAIAAALGAIVGFRKGVVRYRAAMVLALSGVLATIPSTMLSRLVDNRILLGIFSIILLYIAYKTFRNRNVELLNTQGNPPPCVINSLNGRFIWNSKCAISMILAGGVTGFFSGLVGVGGGFVIVPALQRLSVLSTESVVSTSLAVITLVSLVTIGSNAVSGHVDWQIGIPFAIGTLAGMLLGRRIAMKLNNCHLRLGFALLSILAAILMIVKALITT